MARIAKRLTKEDLLKMGILDVKWDSDNNKWLVLRKWWPVGCSRAARIEDNKVITVLNESEAVCKHKYGNDKVYYKYSFSYNNRQQSIPVARLVLAWIFGEIPEGSDACHGEYGELDNSPTNIFIDTHAHNIQQRNRDYQLKCFNQYHNSKDE